MQIFVYLQGLNVKWFNSLQIFKIILLYSGPELVRDTWIIVLNLSRYPMKFPFFRDIF